jgi:hypothetical protein
MRGPATLGTAKEPRKFLKFLTPLRGQMQLLGYMIRYHISTTDRTSLLRTLSAVSLDSVLNDHLR